MGLADRLRELADEAEAMEARLMPDGLSWPIVDGQPVDFVTGYDPSLGVLEAVSIYNNGACQVMSHDGIVKRAMEIYIAAPKVLDADGAECHVGDHGYWLDQPGIEVIIKRIDSREMSQLTVYDTHGRGNTIGADEFTHERPDTRARVIDGMDEETVERIDRLVKDGRWLDD